MNRRGHIGTILMVFGTLLLVGVALYSFYGFKDDVASLHAELNGLSAEMWDVRNIASRYIETLILESLRQSKDSENFKETFKTKLRELTIVEAGKDYFQKTDDKSIKIVKDNVFAKIVDGKFTVENFGDEENYLLSLTDLFFSVNTGKNGRSVSSIDYRFNIVSKFNKEKIDYLSMG